MALHDKIDIKLGETKAKNVKDTDTNFSNLFDDVNTLEDEISAKPNKSEVVPTDPNGTDPLIDADNKISMIYIPDAVMGQLTYMGTWNASVQVTGAPTPFKGDYYVCNTAGNYTPNGKYIAPPSGMTYTYFVGDWAVYNGTSWDRVANTDAVTMVNEQIGSVKTYKGYYNAAVNYYVGDIVLNNTDGCLYLKIMGSDTPQPITDNNYWKIFGKIYSNATTSASGLMSNSDKSKLDNIKTTGGTVGQVLKCTGAGVAEWGTDNDTKYTAGDGLSLTDTKFSVTTATDSTFGGLKTGYVYSTARPNSFPVGLNSGKAYASIPDATTSTNGLMSYSDKTKLENIKKATLPISASSWTGSTSPYYYNTNIAVSSAASICGVYDEDGEELDIAIVRNASGNYSIKSDIKFAGNLEYNTLANYTATPVFFISPDPNDSSSTSGITIIQQLDSSYNPWTEPTSLEHGSTYQKAQYYLSTDLIPATAKMYAAAVQNISNITLSDPVESASLGKNIDNPDSDSFWLLTVEVSYGGGTTLDNSNVPTVEIQYSV